MRKRKITAAELHELILEVHRHGAFLLVHEDGLRLYRGAALPESLRWRVAEMSKELEVVLTRILRPKRPALPQPDDPA